jgi:hypothetical protein
LHTKHGVSDRISYQSVDILDIPFEESLDLIVFKSVLGALGMYTSDAFEAQRAAIAGMYRALKPGGEVWWVENAAGSRAHQFFRSHFSWGAKGWTYFPLSQLPRLFEPFDRWSMTTVGLTAAFGRSEAQRRALATVDRKLLEHVCPRRWRYVVAGLARKAR